MHIALLSGGTGWHVLDLARAASLLGHTTSIVDFRGVQALLGNVHSPQRREDHMELGPAEFDAVIVRTMPPGSLEQVVFRMDVLHWLQGKGVRVLNPPRAIEVCVDKYLAGVRLERAGLPVPPTLVCQDADSAMAAFGQLGGDVVVKPLFGAEGRGMVRVSDPELAWRCFRTLERLANVLYLQKFIPHPGWDLRVFVLAGRVLCAMRRHAKNDWRTNVAQGGRAEAVSLSNEEERLALAACQACGAVVGGVDLLPRPEGGYYVLEVNAVPGWRALAPATGVDVAAAIVEYLARQS
jgi:ribosomal protein S6--L-glutamate ligase